MNKIIPIASFVLLLLLNVFVASTALAADTGNFVACNGVDCDTCDLVDMFNKIIKWLIGFLFVIFAVLVFVSGFKLVTSGGNTGALEEAKKSMGNAFIGIIIVFSAWIIINTLFNQLLHETNTPLMKSWSQIQCFPQEEAKKPVAAASGPGTLQASAGCTTCEAIPSSIPTNGNACASGFECKLHPEMTERLSGLDLAGNDLRVSEAWPPTGYSASDPTGVHASACHGDATCIDVSYNKSDPSPSEIQAFITSAKAKGLTAEYEVKTDEKARELRAAGVENVLVVPGINRQHFSVYMCDKTTNNACDRAKK